MSSLSSTSQKLEGCKKLKEHMAGMPVENFEVLTFSEIRMGDKFILFPLPGDNKYDSGYLKIPYVFLKCRINSAVNIKNGITLDFDSDEAVLRLNL